MVDRMKQENWRQKLTSWVDGEREPKDQTLFVMEQRSPRHVRPSDEEHERREKHRLHRFFNWYPIAEMCIRDSRRLLWWPLTALSRPAQENSSGLQQA